MPKAPSTRPDSSTPPATAQRHTAARPSQPQPPALPQSQLQSRTPPVGRIPVLDVSPSVERGARPAKSVVGEPFEVTATVFREGDGAVGANVVLRDPLGRSGPWTPMRLLDEDQDRWGAEVVATAPGRWTYSVEAWSDPLATWRQHAEIKIPAGIDTALVLEEGARLLLRAARGVPQRAQRLLVEGAAQTLRLNELSPLVRLRTALDVELTRILTRYPLRELVSASRPAALQVDRERALYGSWYEFFPRSEGAVVDPSGRRAPVSGTLRTAAERLPAVAAMGFDVVYLPPIHPIGRAYRKGANNSLEAGPGDVGSPWAIGSPEGGHDAVHPDLGTIEDFDAFVARAAGLGMEVALDFALQCSPDHPWVEKHPEWFTRRADGTIAYAENPPKKYQDIFPINFDQDFEGLVAETLRLLRYWMAHGVRIFRVDNPHTKPVVFWEKVLGEIARTDPDVLFLAEAFTRPSMMRTLSKVGFHQSYTYFTWRTGKQELTEYLTELSGETASYLRPNLFPSTPDILHAYLQEGGRPAFAIRAILAATLSPSMGVYSGYELSENAAAAPGTEDFLDSEKFQLRPRDWARPDSLAPLLTTLNTLRREHRALQLLRNLRFHHTDNDQVLAYSKRHGEDTVLVVVNLDPHHTHHATVTLDLAELGLAPDSRFEVQDRLSGERYRWGVDNYVRLDPARQPAHILTVHQES
ncbi:alpha-1,4-glucan--maltose-1-phosphate maltosyltransferase [Streptacidiphilus jeojiensis]|uniref:alpha-1,4-glucan--maltose-1-phosphate maltosyltransferase n=1 Tax=Streptacidiphilus jeojiensis TaxID=3229225 RepID=UPI0036D42CD0